MYLWRTTYEFHSRHSYNWNGNYSFHQWDPWERTPLIVPPQYKVLLFYDTIMAILAIFATIAASAFGAYALTPKPATVSIKEKTDELIPW